MKRCEGSKRERCGREIRDRVIEGAGRREERSEERQIRREEVNMDDDVQPNDGEQKEGQRFYQSSCTHTLK